MNKSFSLAGTALAILIVISSHAYSRGGGGGGGGRQYPGPQQNSTPAPTPTPTPAPVAVQGVITDVTPFAVTIKAGPQELATIFKVSRDTVITVGGNPALLATLKPGMLVSIMPAPDKIYATSVAATIPAAAAPVAAGTAAVPSAAPAAPAASYVPQPGSSTSAPFGIPNMP